MENLAQALRLDRETQAAIVGAGGKTTVLFRLARELKPPVFLAASAHLGAWQLKYADEPIHIERSADLDFLEQQVPERVWLFTGPLDAAKTRTRGLDAASLERLHQIARLGNIPLLIEADGSRRLPLKAPADHEPSIPLFVNTVLVIAGLSALGRPLDAESVYGAERFAALAELALGEAITPEAVKKVYLHPEGGRKNIPSGARSVAILNQVDTSELRHLMGATARRLLAEYDAVAVTSLTAATDPNSLERPLGSVALPPIAAVYEPAAAIVLAAGGSRRMGAQKLLLPWRGEAVIRHAVQIAIKGGAQPVIVVTGSNGEAVRGALEGLPVQFAHNPDWAAGQGISVAVGVEALPANTGSALFLLGDQPQIPAKLVTALMDAHAYSHSLAVAPFVNGRRGNPVLFDRMLFGELAQLTGDAGGRQVLSRIQVEALEWPDESILLDLDTPEDYERLKAGSRE